MSIYPDEYEYERITYCDIYDCADCPRCGDDCEGDDEYLEDEEDELV